MFSSVNPAEVKVERGGGGGCVVAVVAAVAVVVPVAVGDLFETFLTRDALSGWADHLRGEPVGGSPCYVSTLMGWGLRWRVAEVTVVVV